LDAGMAVEKIFTDGPCTACEKELFFSHRADAGKAGRMMSVIGIVGTDAGRADVSSATT
jgi:copper oxidase (laccase) domain-containing protein